MNQIGSNNNEKVSFHSKSNTTRNAQVNPGKVSKKNLSEKNLTRRERAVLF